MKKYAILTNPGHNRIYFETSKKLAILELSIVLSNCDLEINQVKDEYISDVFYITFLSSEELEEKTVANLSRLSFLYALFEIKEIDSSLYLKPICKPDIEYINSSISSILKYTGKTNEIFTRMLINVGLFSSKFSDNTAGEINILDPIAGKGTTLYEGLIFGHNSYGIEISDKVALESYHYMKRFLEREKFKHTLKTEKVNKPPYKCVKYSFDISKTKDDLKNKNIKNWTMVSGNSMYADKYYKKNFFHLIVGDLPYGVQHGNVTNEKDSRLTRNPKELVGSCIKGWSSVLKSQGVLVLAWNSFLLSREEFAELLENNGFSVFNDDVYQNFEHRVDQAIRRDVIVAKKL